MSGLFWTEPEPPEEPKAEEVEMTEAPPAEEETKEEEVPEPVAEEPQVQPSGIVPKDRIKNVIRVSDLKDFADPKNNMLKSQHILTCQWCNLFSGILLLLFTCGATMIRLGAPSQYAEVSAPVLKLMEPSSLPFDYTKTFMQIESVDDVYEWLTSSVEPIMYDSATYDTTREGEVGLYTTIVGGIRVKKTSIESSDCSGLDDDYKQYATTGLCYTTKGGVTDDDVANSIDDTAGSSSMSFWLTTAETSSHRTAKIAKYNTAGWLDHTTNEVKVDVLMYNPNYRIYSVLHATLNFAKGGKLVPAYYVEAMPAEPEAQEYFTNYWSGGTLANYVFDFLMYIFFVPLVIESLAGLWSVVIQGKPYAYMTVKGGAINLIAIVLMSLGMYHWEQFKSEVEEGSIADIEFPITSYGDLEETTNLLVKTTQVYAQYKVEMSFVIIFLAIRVLFLVHFQPYLAFFIATLANAGTEILNCLVLFAFVFFGFAVSGWHLFGQTAPAYGTLWEACVTNFDFMLGNYEFGDVKNAHEAGAYGYFILFMIVIYVIFFNILLCIMLSGYQSAKVKLAKLGGGHTIMDDMKYLLKILNPCNPLVFNKFPAAALISERVGDMPANGTLTVEDIETLFFDKKPDATLISNMLIIAVQRTIRFEDTLMHDESFTAPVGPAAAATEEEAPAEPVVINNYYQSPEAPAGGDTQRTAAEKAALEELLKQSDKSRAESEAQLKALEEFVGASTEESKKHAAQELASLKSETKEHTAAEIAALKELLAGSTETQKEHAARELAALKEYVGASTETQKKHAAEELAELKELMAGTSADAKAHAAEQAELQMSVLKSQVAAQSQDFKAHTSSEIAALQEQCQHILTVMANLNQSLAGKFSELNQNIEMCKNDIAQVYSASDAAAAEVKKGIQAVASKQEIATQSMKNECAGMLSTVQEAIAEQQAGTRLMKQELKYIEEETVKSMQEQQVELHRDMQDAMAKQQMTLRQDISKWSNSVVKQQHVVTEMMKAQQHSLHKDMMSAMQTQQKALHQDLTESLAHQQEEVAKSMVEQQEYMHEQFTESAAKQHLEVTDSIKKQEDMSKAITDRLDYIQWVKDDAVPTN